jgi:hypothetical protein
MGEVLGQLPVLGALFDPGWFNQPEQIAVGHLLNLREPQPTVQEPLPIVPDHGPRDIQCPGNLSIAQGGVLFQSDYVSDIPHPFPLSCHSISFEA